MTTPINPFPKLRKLLRERWLLVVFTMIALTLLAIVLGEWGLPTATSFAWGGVWGAIILLIVESYDEKTRPSQEATSEGSMIVAPEIEISSDQIDIGNIPAPESHRASTTANPFTPTDAQRFSDSLSAVLRMPADASGRISVNRETLTELFNLGKHLAEELDLVEGTGLLIGVDFGAEGKTAMVVRRATIAVEEDACKLYEKIRDNKSATRSWDDLPDVERWIWRRVVRLASQGRERLKAHMLDEPAITKAESAQRAFQKAVDDPMDDTGWAEPMTEAVAAAFEQAIEELSS